MLYFGSAIFKIARLLLIAMMCVHFFSCIYYRVKKETTPNPDDVEAFYQSKYVDQDVSHGRFSVLVLDGVSPRVLTRPFHLAAGSPPCLRKSPHPLDARPIARLGAPG